jgi:hypothetical protein
VSGDDDEDEDALPTAGVTDADADALPTAGVTGASFGWVSRLRAGGGILVGVLRALLVGDVGAEVCGDEVALAAGVVDDEPAG